MNKPKNEAAAKDEVWIRRQERAYGGVYRMTQDKPKNKAREWAQALTQAAAEGKQIEVWDARPKNKAAQDLGSLGGKAGKGAAKRRSAEHYKRMVEARAEQRRQDQVKKRLSGFWQEQGGIVPPEQRKTRAEEKR